MRNSVDELFVEGTCNVFGVDVCVVLLWWSFVGYTVYCVPVGVCVSSVVPGFFDVFPPDFCLVCGWRSLCLTPVYWDLVACFCLSSFCVLFCCVWVVVGVCLCCES